MKLIKQKTMKVMLKTYLEQRGFKQNELQISKSAIDLLDDFIVWELSNVMKEIINYTMDYNAKHTYKPFKRITSNLIEKAPSATLYPELSLYLTSRQLIISKSIVSENGNPIGYPKREKLGIGV